MYSSCSSVLLLVFDSTLWRQNRAQQRSIGSRVVLVGGVTAVSILAHHKRGRSSGEVVKLAQANLA